MDHEQMMLECIKLAVGQGLKGEEARTEARRMYNQIRGRTDDTPDPKAPKARAVGRDGELEKPFKDYLSKDE